MSIFYPEATCVTISVANGFVRFFKEAVLFEFRRLKRLKEFLPEIIAF